MTARTAHMVGSLPGGTAHAAMNTALDICGPYLRSLPDGETGERSNWIIPIVESMRANTALKVSNNGDWSGYDQTLKFRVRRGHTLYGGSLDMGHVAATSQSFPIFEQAKAATGHPDIVFQQGVPGDFDLAMFSMGPVQALRHREPFAEATLTEIRDVRAITGPDTLFQLELCAELSLMAKFPAVARARLAKSIAKIVYSLAASTPAGTRFGLHLCLGDLNNKAFAFMKDVSPVTILANAILDRWPDGRELAVIHGPFAAGDRPATLEPGYYQPLAKLRLPNDVVFAAGFAHESQTVSDQKQIRSRIEDHLQRQVAVSSACGLGRRSEADARVVLQHIAELCED